MPATTTEQIHRLFEDAFNAGDIDGLMVLYEPDSVLVPQPRSVGDLAYLSNTWSLSGTGPDGNPLTLGATTAEVARRQADATWR